MGNKFFKFSLAIAFVFLCSAVLCQHYPDREMQGIKVPVKKSSVKIYRDIILIDSVWQPRNINVCDFEIVSFYNVAGFLDSVWYVSRVKENVVYARDNDRQIGGVYKNDTLAEMFTIKWLDKLNYIQTHYDTFGRPVSETEVKLSEKLIEQESGQRTFDTLGNIQSHIKFEYNRDKNDWIDEVWKFDVLKNEILRMEYFVRKYNSYGLPIESEEKWLGETKPDKLYYRTFEFY